MVEAEPRSIAIVGGGVAGLQALHSLLQLPRVEKIVLFEKSDTIGGVWRENYFGYGAQVKRDQYSFPELGPAGLDLYPTGAQLKAHCHAYCETFGLWPYIRLSTDVQHLTRRAGPSGFRVAWKRASDAESEEEDFDFVVMAVGNFSKPFIPELNHSHFMGRILHSSELVDPEMLQNHHVVVVGYGKSALDCFILASKFASSATLVARRPAWILPQRFLGIPLEYLASTRWFAHVVFPPYYNASRLRRWIGVFLWPLQALLWWILVPILWFHFRLPRAMWPSHSLAWQLWHGHSVSICDPAPLKEALRRGARMLRGQLLGLTGTGCIIGTESAASSGGEAPVLLTADVVVFATGYQESWSKLFDEETLKALDPHGEGPELYKLILPDLPGLAFLGRILTTCDIVTSFVQAQWLQALLAHQIPRPAPAVRQPTQKSYREWRRSFAPVVGHTMVAVPRVFDYLDELMDDLQVWPSGRDRFLGLFQPLTAQTLLAAMARARATASPVQGRRVVPVA
ncbi:unnamed protein product [Durusdinium trenchii]|uniref:Flavin-containing monooxygenase 5 (FMO 5) (Dimethylaniline monooxygenase [N-oxide-forming] 5) (Dimethylaniline oxidase 5) (Hepatic flavin-containing monooxygenase 5) (NAPDH oxidase) n=2 Tax=Durusdinium trenchii TaxID=1381693 RepID=A0ABP0KIY7_9DINO